MPVDLTRIDLTKLNREQSAPPAALPAVMGQAEQIDSNRFADLNRLSMESGMPVSAVESDPDAVRSNLNLQRIDFTGMSQRNPNTTNFLTTFDNAVMAKDDISTLTGVEDLFKIGADVGRSVPAGLVQNFGMATEGAGRFIELGGRTLARGADMLLPESLDQYIWETPEDSLQRYVDVAAFLRWQGAGLKETSEAIGPDEEDKNLATEIAGGVGQMIGQIATYLVAPQAALPGMFFQGIDQQGERQEATGTEGSSQTSDNALLLGGATTLATEKLGIDQMLERIPPNIKNDMLRYVADVAIAGGIEGLQEIVEGIGQSVIEQMSTNPDAQLLEGAVDEGAVGFGVGAVVRALVLMATPGNLRNTVADELKREAETSRDQSTLEKLNELAENSKLRQRSPETFSQFVEQSASEDRSHVYIDAAQVALYLAEQGREVTKDPALMLIAERVRESAQTGVDVSIPVQDFATVIAGTPHFEALRDSMTMTPDGIAPFRQESVRAENQTILEDIMREAQVEVSEYVESQEIYETVRQQLVDTGMVSAQHAAVMAQVVPVWAAVFAQKNGITVAEAYARSGLTIEGPQTGEMSRLQGELLKQAQSSGYVGENVTEAREWTAAVEKFGAEGMTTEARMARAQEMGFDTETVLYHGTLATFNAFKGLTFLTSEASEASAYAGTQQLRNANRVETLRNRYIESTDTSDLSDVETLPYVGIISDIPVDQRDQWWATDEGVIRFTGPDLKQIEVATDYVVEYGTGSTDGENIRVTKGDGSSSLQALKDDVEDIASRMDTDFGQGNVIPVYTPKGKYKQIDALTANLLGARVQDNLSPNLQARLDRLLADIEVWKSEGFIGIETISDDGIMMGEAIPQRIIFDPANIRSINAAFDPDFKDSADLLAQSISQTETEAFKKWFGDSKVVDENGDPLVVYHGTSADFDAFDPSMSKRLKGLWFTSSSRWRGYAEGDGANVMPVYLSMKNPTDDPYLFRTDSSFDGLIFPDRTSLGVASYAVREPTQIKSAIGNSGTFDPNDPSILNQNGPTARGYYDPQNSIIRLTEAADLSTFLHEFAHFMYEMELKTNSVTAMEIKQWFKRNAADVAAEASGYLAEQRDGGALEQSKKTNDQTIYWHGSASGDLRGGSSGLHLGTKLAATQALEARIGVPASGEWDGTREYGNTLLAGKQTLARLGKERGYFLTTGMNAGSQIPEDDYYPIQSVKYPDGTVMPKTVKPSVRPFRLNAEMTNSKNSAHDDYKANGYMKASLRKGNAKRGYYYRNVAEDGGSISVVVPNGEFVTPVDEQFEQSVSYNSMAPEKKLSPFQPAIDAAKRVAVRLGIQYEPPREYALLDKTRAKKIAIEYELAPHAPDDPLVQAAYGKLAEETIVQFEEVMKTGLTLDFIRGEDPYAKSPRLAIDDVRENNHLWVYSTRDGFGSNQDFDPKDNPLLAETDFEINGEKLLVNDLFRIVHDYFGHIKGGNGFRAEGEENAWQAHAAMYSPLARRALTTETRGQNSWVNFGPYAEHNRTASAKTTKYADQKTTLLPLWVSEEGKVNEEKQADDSGRDENGRIVRPPVRDGRIALSHFSRTAGITRIDPAFYGSNYAGAEKERAASPNWLNRAYFGIAPGQPGGYNREFGVGNNEYSVSVEAGYLYDMANDPDNLGKGLGVTSYEKAIRDAGYSGFWIQNKKLGMVAAVFDPLLVENGEGALAQGIEPPQQTPSGAISPEEVVTYMDTGTTGDAAKDAAIRRAAHEQFARGWEKYLMEGKAPSIELRNVFRTFARWLTRIYNSVKNQLNVKLDDQIRQVMGRMLATEEQIAAAESRARYKPLFTDAAMAGMTETQFAEYQKQSQVVKDAARETLRDKLIAQLKRQTEAWWNEERDDLAVEAREQLQTTLVYRAISTLRTGEMKLDHAITKEMVGEVRTDKRGIQSTRIPEKLNGMTIKGAQGVHPDEAAAFLGFGSGSEMIDAIVKAPSLREAAQAQAEQQMMEKHGDILNDGSIQRQADEALQNEERAKLLLTELKTLAKGTAVPTIDRATIEALAIENIGKQAYRNIQPGRYRKAELRAAQEAAVALSKGDKEGAARAKLRQIMNYYLSKAAQEARDGTLKIVDTMARYNRRSVQEEILKADGGYWGQIVKILQRFEFRKAATMKAVDQVNQDINTWMLERIETDGDALVLTNAVLNEGYKTHWKNVPYAELQGIADSVKNIEHVARYSNKITRMGEEVEFKQLVTRWVDHMNDKVKSVFKTQRTSIIEGRNWGNWAMAQMTKIPYMASWLDGQERVGLSHQILVQPATDALDAEYKLFTETGAPVTGAIVNRSKADLKRHNRKIFIAEIKDANNDGNLMGHQILAVALNTGNAGNLKKMLLGEGWANPDVDTDISIENPKLQAVLKHMTKSDWDLVQLIWNQMDLLYPQLAEVHRRTTGLVPPKVEAVSVATPFGMYRGGYYPVKYDPARSQKAEENEQRQQAQVDSMFSSGASIQASVTASATSERTGYYAPIRLSLDVVPNHFQETIHYITHHDFVREVNKLIRNKQVADTIKEKLGPEEFAQLKPWLNDIAKDGRESPNKTFIDSIFGRLRFGVTLGVMGFKASTGIIQISGLSNAIAEVGLSNMYQSLRQILGSPATIKSAWEFASANSKVLEHRGKTMDREMRAALEDLEGKRGIIAAVQEASMKHIAYIQTYMVDLPSWYAGYIKEMKLSGDETKAYQYGDWVVEQVQGSGATKDMSGLLRNQTKTHRLFTMFMTFFSSLWNYQRDMARGARGKQYSTTNVAAKTMFLFTIPVLFEMLLRGELGGDEDDEDLPVQKMLTNLALYPIQGIPFIRDAANATTGEFGYNMSPVASVLEQGILSSRELVTRPFTDEEITLGQVKGASKLTAAMLGIPGVNQAWATGEHLYQVLEEGEDLSARQLLFGPTRE